MWYETPAPVTTASIPTGLSRCQRPLWVLIVGWISGEDPIDPEVMSARGFCGIGPTGKTPHSDRSRALGTLRRSPADCLCTIADHLRYRTPPCYASKQKMGLLKFCVKPGGIECLSHRPDPREALYQLLLRRMRFACIARLLYLPGSIEGELRIQSILPGCAKRQGRFSVRKSFEDMLRTPVGLFSSSTES